MLRLLASRTIEPMNLTFLGIRQPQDNTELPVRPTLKVAHITNIAPPYRRYLFRLISEWLSARGYSFEVHFISGQAIGRPSDWRVSTDNCTFPHRVWRHVGPRRLNETWYLNPGLLWELLVHPPDILIVGGPWSSFTAAIATLIGRRRVGVAWFEPNLSTPGNSTSVGRLIKRTLLNRFHFCVVPGKEGIQWLDWLMNGRLLVPRRVVFPNLIDPTLFRRKSGHEIKKRVRALCQCQDDERLALMPVRLIPAKGICQFLKRLAPSDLVDWHIAIVGDGPLRDQVTECIKERGLIDKVTLLPFQEYDRMAECYLAADLFVLPSLYDPNPLSVVEALCSGLPLLVSNRIGNLPEALVGGSNGWSFDPENDSAASAAVNRAFSATVDELENMGRVSQGLFDGTWEPAHAVEGFMTKLLSSAC